MTPDYWNTPQARRRERVVASFPIALAAVLVALVAVPFAAPAWFETHAVAVFVAVAVWLAGHYLLVVAVYAWSARDLPAREPVDRPARRRAIPLPERTLR